MTNPRGATDAHVFLLAVQAVSDGDLDSLLKIVHLHRDVLSDSLIYRLLLSYYPIETSDQSTVADFLKSIGDASIGAETFSPDPSISSLSETDAIRRCRRLRLRSTIEHASVFTQSELANFVIEWARRLEEVDGATQLAAAFVEEFVEQDPDLRLWYSTYLAPVLRLQYDYYPDAKDVITLKEIENLSLSGGVPTLLQYAKRQRDSDDLARDLEQVVSPWVHGSSRAKRRKVDGHAKGHEVEEQTSWDPVYDWLLSSGMADFKFSAKAYVSWPGPAENEESTSDPARYAKTGLGMIYGCPETSADALAICEQVLGKAAGLVDVPSPDLSQPEPDILIASNLLKDLSEADLMTKSLRQSSNRLTLANSDSIQLLFGLLRTAKILSKFGFPWLISDLARVCIFGSERRHKDELRRLLEHIHLQTRKEIDWQSIRRQILWLHSWTKNQRLHQNPTQPAFLTRLALNYIEIQLVDAMLRAAQYEIVKDIYLFPSTAPLSAFEIESRVLAAIFEAYDNASNGNRDRGGIKRASDILKAFRPHFNNFVALSDAEYLIKATHSLSFYQLTLQHGVPFKPVAIRVQKDPLTLLEKVLEQDVRAYTKLDDLLEIGRNLVRAHLPSRGNTAEASEPLELQIPSAEHRVTYAAIMAALGINDFDTAYAYITTRLHPPPSQTSTSSVTDDTSWRAAYAAGRYRPSTSPKSLTARIDSLVQRMELLSRALMLAPSGEALSGILATWRRYEEELDALKTQAVEEERAFEAKADATLPGAFGMEDRDADVAETKRAMARRTGPVASGPSYEEDAPLGLFDVARGAASALRKTAAFPLGSRGLRDLKIGSGTVPGHEAQREVPSSPTSDDGTRVRKRDMVANMVGSGLGWVLGAQAQDRADYRGDG